MRLLEQALLMLLYRRMCRAFDQIERLAVRFEAGRLWRVVARKPAAELLAQKRVGGERVAGPGAAVVSGGVTRLWPGEFAWLVRRVGWRAVGLGGQLRLVLEQPPMVALLLASPQARRILAPMCRALAIPASVLRPRPDGVAAEAVPEVVAAPKLKRVRAKRVPIDWGRIPLPRGVLSAARRAGFKPVR